MINKKRLNKKIILGVIGSTVSLGIAASIISACAPTTSTTHNHLYAKNTDYNFGIALDAVNSLNYLKFASLRKLAPILVEGMVIGGPQPDTKTGQILGLGKLYVKAINFNSAQFMDEITDDNFSKASIANSYYDITRFGFLLGNLTPYVDDQSDIPIISYRNKNNQIIATKYTLNSGASKWSDGKEVDAQDYIDAIEYILDINNGSQLKSALLAYNIKGTNEMNQAQEEYIKVHKKPYLNPFGRRPYVYNKETQSYEEDYSYQPFQSQTFDNEGNPLDTKEVARIRAAALSIGLSTGRKYDEISTAVLTKALRDKVNVDFDYEADEPVIYLHAEEVQKYGILNAKKLPNMPYYELKLHKNRYFNKRQKYSFEYEKEQVLNSETPATAEDSLEYRELKVSHINENSAKVTVRFNKELENKKVKLQVELLEGTQVVKTLDYVKENTNGYFAKFDLNDLENNKKYRIKDVLIEEEKDGVKTETKVQKSASANSSIIFETISILNQQIKPLLTQSNLVAFQYLPKTEYELLIEYENYGFKQALYKEGTEVRQKQELLPANRRFIETHGGIEKFGSTKEHFVWTGPFDIGEMELGPSGYIYLNKNKEYYNAKNTLSDRIKIFFNSQNEVKSLWFEEGIISSTVVPSSYQLKFWSKEETRNLMKKNQGIGTVAIQFNLDPQSRYSSKEEYEKNKDKKIPIFDPDLRRAIAYATNRESILRLTGWTSSFPVSTWTAFNAKKDSRGRNLELWFDDQRVETEYKEKNEKGELVNKSFPLQNNTFEEHSGKSLIFENINREDKSFNLDVARFYLEKYKQKNKDQDKVVLQFVYASQPDENAKAAITFKDLMERAFGGYVQIDLKSLPSNTYISFIANGKFDISYQNFDKYSGQDGDGSSMLPFFVSDGVDHSIHKTEGYELNPSGGWTFKEFFEKYKDDSTKLEDAAKRLSIPKERLDIIKELAYISNVKTTNFYNPYNKDEIEYGRELQALDKAIPQFTFFVSFNDIEKYNKIVNDDQLSSSQKNEKLDVLRKETTKRIYLDSSFAKYLEANPNNDLYVKVKSQLTNKEYSFKLNDLKTKATLDAITNDYGKELANDIWNIQKDRDVYSFSVIDDLKQDAYDIVEVFALTTRPNNASENWKAKKTTLTKEYDDIEIEVNGTKKLVSSDKVETKIFKTKLEDNEEHRDRIRNFFAGLRLGWGNQSDIFTIVADLEKIIREDVPILSIMDTDTNWSISSLGGSAGEYIYTLNYAYDYRRPPLPKLPTSEQEDK